MAKTVCKILGVVLVIVGLCGFTHLLDFLGAHLTAQHNLIHIVSGVIALYFGFAGTMSAAKGFCLVFGIVYLGLGILGFALGTGGDRIWRVIDDLLMFGRVDHSIHVLLGVIFLAGGLFTKKV
jgi:Domain of unknown function (DUF4383)